jgi:hypothetical protein
MVPYNSDLFHTLFHSIVRLSIIPNWSAGRCHRCRNLLKDCRICFGVSALEQRGRFEHNHGCVRHSTASLSSCMLHLLRIFKLYRRSRCCRARSGVFVTLFVVDRIGDDGGGCKHPIDAKMDADVAVIVAVAWSLWANMRTHIHVLRILAFS